MFDTDSYAQESNPYQGRGRRNFQDGPRQRALSNAVSGGLQPLAPAAANQPPPAAGTGQPWQPDTSLGLPGSAQEAPEKQAPVESPETPPTQPQGQPAPVSPYSTAGQLQQGSLVGGASQAGKSGSAIMNSFRQRMGSGGSGSLLGGAMGGLGAGAAGIANTMATPNPQQAALQKAISGGDPVGDTAKVPKGYNETDTPWQVPDEGAPVGAAPPGGFAPDPTDPVLDANGAVVPGTTPAPDTSAWNTKGFAKPAYTAATPYSAMSGWDEGKWNDPNAQQPKYVIGRILQEAAQGDSLLQSQAERDQAIANIIKAYPGTTFNGKDKITMPDGAVIDIFEGAGSGLYRGSYQVQEGTGKDGAGNPLQIEASMPGGGSGGGGGGFTSNSNDPRYDSNNTQQGGDAIQYIYDLLGPLMQDITKSQALQGAIQGIKV